jgi:hypothetical protein
MGSRLNKSREAGAAPLGDPPADVRAAALPPTKRELEHDPEKWPPVFNKDHAVDCLARQSTAVATTHRLGDHDRMPDRLVARACRNPG